MSGRISVFLLGKVSPGASESLMYMQASVDDYIASRAKGHLTGRVRKYPIFFFLYIYLVVVVVVVQPILYYIPKSLEAEKQPYYPSFMKLGEAQFGLLKG